MGQKSKQRLARNFARVREEVRYARLVERIEALENAQKSATESDENVQDADILMPPTRKQLQDFWDNK